MKYDYYILQSGRIRRKENTVYFENKDTNTPIPVNDINSIMAFGEVDINSKLLIFFSQKRITIHFFNYYSYYSGSFYPRKYLNSGFLLVNQVKKYLDNEKRLFLAREIIKSASLNIIKNLEHFLKNGKDLNEEINYLKEKLSEIDKSASVSELMGIEGNIREYYYSSFNKFIRPGFEFEKRTRRPPQNMLNCLISFGNSLLYSTALAEIYHTQLDPLISYLHEPSERRFSLSLDISEIFKPIIVDKIIFKLINNQMINEKHFEKDMNFCYLNDEGKRLFIQEYDERMRTVIFHKKLNKKISYHRLIRVECYKLIKHLIDEQEYEGFKAWW